MTEPRMRVATLFVDHDTASGALKLSLDQVVRRTGADPQTVKATLAKFVQCGWFGATWEDVDANDLDLPSPRRVFYLCEARRAEVIDRISDYHALKRIQANRVPNGPRGRFVCAPPRPEDDEPLSSYKPPVAKVQRGATRQAILALFLRDPKVSLTSRDIATELERSTSTVHQLLDSYERRGWLVSTTAPGDAGGRPRRIFTLTKAGIAAARKEVGVR